MTKEQKEVIAWLETEITILQDSIDNINKAEKPEPKKIKIRDEYIYRLFLLKERLGQMKGDGDAR